MSGDLAAFLLARIAEDEKAAMDLAVYQSRWRTGYVRDGGGQLVAEVHPNPTFEWSLGDTIAQTGTGTKAIHAAAHIARWEPARVLAECEAKRRIVALHDHWHECTFGTSDIEVGAVQEDEDCPTLLLLAAPYAGHPDFDPAWRL